MDRNRIINIVCIGVILVCGVGIGVMVPGVVEKFGEADKTAQGGDGGEVGRRTTWASDCAEMPEITSLTKEEALDILKTGFAPGKYPYMVCDVLPDGVAGENVYSIVVRAVDDVRAMPEIAGPASLNGEWEEIISVDESNDLYTVMTGRVDRDDEHLIRLVAFREDDLYFDRSSGDGEVVEKIVFKNKDRDFVETVLRVLTRATGDFLPNIYSYEMLDADGGYDFRYYYVSLNYKSSGKYDLTLNVRGFEVDGATGEVVQTKFEVLKGYELFDEEYEEVMELFGGLWGSGS